MTKIIILLFELPVSGNFPPGHWVPAGRTRRQARSGLDLEFNINACGQVQMLQSLDGFIGGTQYIDQSLVGSHLELLTAVLVLMDRS